MKNISPETTYPEAVRKERIKFPILVPLIVSILVLLVTFTLAIYNLQQRHINNDVYMRLDNTSRSFRQFLDNDARLLDATTRFLKNDPNIQNAWLTSDRDRLLGYSAPLFENFHRDYKVTHIYFIDPNGTCFLRVHNPPRFGDRIDRFTFESAARTQKLSSGIELGPYGTFTLRVVQPCFVNNTLIGYIELGEEIEHIIPQLKEALDVDVAILIDKSFLTRQSWEEGLKVMGRSGDWDLMPDCVIADSTIGSVPSEFIKCSGLPHKMHSDRIISATLNGSTYRGGFVKLQDVAGREVGDILVIKNVSSDQASLYTLLEVVAGLCFFIAALLVSFFYVHITHIEKHLINAHASLITEIQKREEAEAELRRHRDNLEETVRSRTAELEETNKHLEGEIAERRRAQEALLNSEERFKQVAQSAGDWIWEVNAEGLYTYSSPVVENVLGYKPEEIIGKKYFYDFFSPEVKEELRKGAFEVFGRKESFAGFVNPVIDKNGNTVILETTGTPVLDNQGRLCGYRGVDRNITERRKAEQRQAQLLGQLEETNKRLQQEVTQRARAEKSLGRVNEDLESTITQLIQSNRQLREFDHLVAHDLKTPLRGISTLAQWLVDDYYDKLDDNARRQIDLLVKRVRRMDNIVNAILQYTTTVRDGHSEYNVDLDKLLHEVLDGIKHPSNIEIAVKNKLPALICEESYIRQVFRHLIDNAVKFMDKHHGRIEVDCTEEDRSWQFSVSDNGPGIERKHFARIFNLFQKLDASEDTDSAGVGLALVRKIVELYGGQIWLTSKVDQGSTFFFTLPKQPDPVATRTPQPTAM